MLRIGECILHRRTEHHFLSRDEVICLVVDRSACQHTHYTCIDSGFAGAEEAVVNDIHRFGLAGNYTMRHA